MKKFIFLALASGFNRAGIFLLSPIIAFLVTVDEYGIFSLYLSFSTLLIILISANFSSIIAREIYENLITVVFYIKIINTFLIFILLVSITLLVFTKTLTFSFIIFIASEAIFLINTTYIRYRKGDDVFFYNTLTKFFILALAFYVFFNFYSLYSTDKTRDIFILMSLSNIVAFKESYRFIMFSNFNLAFIKIKSSFKYIIFAFMLLPHIFSQWVMSGSDRYFVKMMYTPNDLGVYSFAYSLASIFMLVNAALSLALPQIAVKNIKYYKSNKFIFNLFISTSFFYILILSMIFFSLPYFSNYKTYPVFKYSFVVLSGLYFLCYYTYYSSYLFYNRDAKYISLISIGCAIITIPSLFLFSYLWGVFGIAFVSFLIYFIYALVITLRAAKKHCILLFIPLSIVSIMYFIFSYN
ncbi:hypothetical protein R0L47_02800 [Pectobacterium polonicum]|uniref:lipopolysaccharide biosynthesis protein n=1 Tax=Pectobacterium polonicum TaxID=2485124 RepID=UPI0037541DFC